MEIKEYHRPSTLDEALSLIRRKTPHTAVLAGGTWLNGETPRDIEAVVDISKLGLDRVDRQGSPPLVRIGAAATLQSLVDALRDTPGLDVLATTAHAMAGLNIRNQATLGGAIVTANASSPLVTALLACEAELVIQADEERTVALSGFLSYRERMLAEGILITEVRMPIPSADTRAVYERVARTPRDYPIVCAVARCAVKDGIAGNVRIAVGGVTPTPIRLSAMEFALEKKTIAEHLDRALSVAVGELAPQNDWLGSAEYRAEMARVLVRRAVEKAAGIA
jgi:probable selenate reductase FAD-binding subunit